MYGPIKYYSSILGYSTTPKTGRSYSLANATNGIYDYSYLTSGFDLPYFIMSLKLRTKSMGPLRRSSYNDVWQKLDFSFMAGRQTKTTEIIAYMNERLNLISASVDKAGVITLTPSKCTDNPEEEALVDFLITGPQTNRFDSERSTYNTFSLFSTSIFPNSRSFGKSTGIANISNNGFGFSTTKMGSVKCPPIIPNTKDIASGTLGYITCCDGYTPTVKHQPGKWDFTGLYAPLLFIRMFNKDTLITAPKPEDSYSNVFTGVLIVKLEAKLYTTNELANTINVALAEISPCNKVGEFDYPCSQTNGTLPFAAGSAPDGRLMICQSFYELSFSGSCSYITDVFSFDRIVEGQTCSLNAGYVLKNIITGCANDGFNSGKTSSEIITDINNIEYIKQNKLFEIFEYTPKPIIEDIRNYTSNNLSYAYAPTMTGPISDSPFAYNNSKTSLPSSYFITNQYRPNSPYSEFWATYNLNEYDVLNAIGKQARIIGVIALKASIRASWNYFGYMSGAYITYPFYNWGLVLNTSSYCTLYANEKTDAIYFSEDGIYCKDVGRDFTTPIKPDWDNNLDCLQYLRAYSKACNTDMAQIKNVEIPRIYGNYRAGVVFDWKRWSRYNPNGVDSLNFEGAFATPSITFRIAYIRE